jgi:hypothetical protein
MSHQALNLDGERKWTIALRPTDGERARKVTKIVGLNGGGFSLRAPYHKSKSGFLYKMPVDPKVIATPGTFEVSNDDVVGFTVDDRVKLSYHTDGFAQFSSETTGRVISGRDPETGEPKGLGLFTHPLTRPIWSGASVGITVWGIDDFEETKENDKPLVLFEPDEFYYRGCAPQEANGWILSIYAFPINVIPPVRFHRGSMVVDVVLQGLNGPLAAVAQLKVIHLRNEKVFLGVLVNSVITDFPSKSGWALQGPGDYTPERKGHVLMGIYPREMIGLKGRESLDRPSPPVPGATSGS